MKFNSLKDLFVEQLRDLYSAETQLIRALPRIAKAASSADLQLAFETHLQQTKTHVSRLEQIFERLHSNPKGKWCKAMEGLVEEAREALILVCDPEIREAALIAAMQRIEHYEIAGYSCARTFASVLGDQESADLLQQTLDEEQEVDTAFNEFALNAIAVQTAVPEVQLTGGKNWRGESFKIPDAGPTSGSLIDEAMLESFPASDPPCWTLGR